MSQLEEWNNHKGDLILERDDYKVIDCNNCLFKHIIPIPTDITLNEIYSHDYYSKEKPNYLEEAKKDNDWWKIVYNDRYKLLETHLDGSSEKTILDVGSGPGFFLLEGKALGWKTIGIEPSSQAAEFSRGMGLEIIEQYLTEDLVPSMEKVDVVHLNNVLEHLRDPIAMIKVARQVLNDSGLICIIIPNDFNPFQMILYETMDFDPWWVAPPYHINYFNFDSITQLLQNYGFDIIYKESTFPIDSFLLMGDNYIGNNTLGRECHGKRMNFEKNVASWKGGKLIRKLYQSYAELGIGRECVVIAKKTNK